MRNIISNRIDILVLNLYSQIERKCAVIAGKKGLYEMEGSKSKRHII
jgi:hypothetical protein